MCMKTCPLYQCKTNVCWHLGCITDICAFYKQGAKFSQSQKKRGREDRERRIIGSRWPVTARFPLIGPLLKVALMTWLTDWWFIFANEGTDHVGAVFEWAQHTDCSGSTARTQAPASFQHSLTAKTFSYRCQAWSLKEDEEGGPRPTGEGK